jgi:membrane-associated protease RseP (regulator of RpoE activity)
MRISPEEVARTLQVFGPSRDDRDLSGLAIEPIKRRRPVWLIPSVLLVSTIVSMAWAGIVAWAPFEILAQATDQQSLFVVRQHVLANWASGLLFSISLAIILGAHELGHYIASKLYGIPSTLPLFIPFPFSPTGTCGAVIMMDGNQADRKQFFDIGIAGPIAGLVFAIPIAILGLTFSFSPQTTSDSIQFGQPLIIQALNYLVNSDGAVRMDWIANSSMNPMLMAAWVGFLVTGLNMIPISQLDGGHVIFGLLGRRSKGVAWAAYLVCVAIVIYSSLRYGQPMFVLMLLLIPLMGITHPQSRDDFVEIGVFRTVLGWASLTIPILCIPLRPVALLGY